MRVVKTETLYSSVNGIGAFGVPAVSTVPSAETGPVMNSDAPVTLMKVRRLMSVPTLQADPVRGGRSCHEIRSPGRGRPKQS